MTKPTDNKRSIPQPLLSRCRLIEQHVQNYLRETAVSQMTFATEVREIYEQLPEAQRIIEWSQRSDVFERAKRDAEKLFRYFYKNTLSVDLEDAIVLALPDDRRDALEYALASRRGRISVCITAGGDVSQHDLAKEVGEAVIAMGDDDIDHKIKEFEEASAVLQTAANKLKAVRGDV